MFKHILIATDGSDLAERAASQGLELAKALGAKVTAVAVTEPWTAVVTGEAALGFPPADYEKGVIETAANVLARVHPRSLWDHGRSNPLGQRRADCHSHRLGVPRRQHGGPCSEGGNSAGPFADRGCGASLDDRSDRLVVGI